MTQINQHIFSAVAKQFYEWFSPSVFLPVRPSITPFALFSHHHMITKWSRVIIIDKSNVHVKGQGQRSKVKITGVKKQFYNFWTVITVWIHIYASEMMHKAWCCTDEVLYCFQGHPWNFKVITHCKKWPILTRIECFQTVTLVWIQRWLWYDAQGTRLEVA